LAGAADALGVLAPKGKSETIRLGAVRAVLEQGNRLREAVEMEARIAALEAGSTKRGIR
jgi:hypothetical protein